MVHISGPVPPVLPRLHLLDHAEQWRPVVSAPDNFCFEHLLGQPFPVLGVKIEIIAHGTIQRARMQVSVLIGVIAYSEFFLLLSLLESNGFGINPCQHFVEAFRDCAEQRIQSLCVLDGAESFSGTLRTMDHGGCSRHGRPDTRNYGRKREIIDRLKLAQCEVVQGETATRSGFRLSRRRFSWKVEAWIIRWRVPQQRIYGVCTVTETGVRC